MLRTGKALQLVARQAQYGHFAEALGGTGWNASQTRGLGGDKVPEYWGKPSPYTEGTAFLGTPPNHDQLINKRPLSPDVFELGSVTQPHYKMPWGAVSSIANRATGAALSAGFAAAGYIALTGDLPGALASFKANYPLLVFPTKLIISFPLVYHYLGGMRHFVWDLHKIGNQADKTSLLETPRVEQSSQILLGASVALSLLAAIL
ncbi:succinate dehydrogenase subunit b560 [Scenedesmus sp. NREL 46B-D3]|nr:succinate dehydrogenase subunit b560 [Scenedesmus sp. NREL 46B-D3]